MIQIYFVYFIYCFSFEKHFLQSEPTSWCAIPVHQSLGKVAGRLDSFSYGEVFKPLLDNSLYVKMSIFDLSHMPVYKILALVVFLEGGWTVLP